MTERDYFKEYFEKIAEIQEELENGGDAVYKGSYKSLHAGQALLYDMAASAAVKAEAAKDQADQNKRDIAKNAKHVSWLAIGVGLVVLVSLPEVIIWLEANWPFF